MNAAKIVFAGTPNFALASLRALVVGGSIPVAVLTQPDRPAGRGNKIKASPVKTYSMEKNIPVLHPQAIVFVAGTWYGSLSSASKPTFATKTLVRAREHNTVSETSNE